MFVYSFDTIDSILEGEIMFSNESSKNDFNPVCKTFHIDIESGQCPLKTNRVRAPAIH